MKEKVEKLRASRKRCGVVVGEEIMCQTCRYHSNKPSRCTMLGEVFFVKRKAVCELYL